jgi:serine/threonine protein kinase
MADFSHEVIIMRLLSHPNLIKIYEVFYEADNLKFVTDLYGKMDLYNFNIFQLEKV